MLEHLIELDKEFFLVLNGLGTKSWDGFWLFYTTKLNWIPLYAILCYLLFKKLNLKSFLLALVIIVLLITFTDQIANLFKRNIMRPRPCYDEVISELVRLVKASCGGRHGYFSGHASNSMGIAIFLGVMLRKNYKHLIYLLIFWAFLMAYSRIYIGVHYPLDVLTGMLFGGFSGYLFFKLFEYLQCKFQF